MNPDKSPADRPRTVRSTPRAPKSSLEVEQELLRLCGRKRAVDDELGKCSDHQGDQSGQTYYQFKNMRAEGYDRTLDYYIGEHEKAIRILNRLRALRRIDTALKGVKELPNR